MRNFFKTILSEKKYWTCFSLLCFCVLFIFLLQLKKTSFDSDEIYSAMFSRESYFDLLSGNVYDGGNPPFHFILLKTSFSLFGEDEFVARLISVVSLLATLFILSFFCLQYLRLSKLGTFCLILLTASSQFMFFYSKYARPYSFLVLCSVITFYYIFLLLESNLKGFSFKKYGPGIIFTTLGFYTHYSFVVFCSLLVITTIVVFYSQLDQIKKLIKYFSLPTLLFSPWALFFIKNQMYPRDQWYKYDFWQLYELSTTPLHWINILSNNLVRFSWEPQLLSVISSAIFLLLGVFGLIHLKRAGHDAERLIILFPILSFLIFFFTPLHSYFSDARYFIFIIPFCYLFIIWLFEKQKRFFINKCFYALIMVNILFNWQMLFPQSNRGWRESGEYLSSSTNNAIIVTDICHKPEITSYYYRGKSIITCLDHIKNNTQDYELSRYGEIFFIRSQNSEEKPFSELPGAGSYQFVEEYNFDVLSVARFRRNILL